MTYDSDITDTDWAILSIFLVRKKRCGPKSRIDLRVVVNGIFYRLRTGCQWRYLPREYGDWRVVSAYFYRWSRCGVWEHQYGLAGALSAKIGQIYTTHGCHH
jgi:putative transposase